MKKLHKLLINLNNPTCKKFYSDLDIELKSLLKINCFESPPDKLDAYQELWISILNNPTKFSIKSTDTSTFNRKVQFIRSTFYHKLQHETKAQLQQEIKTLSSVESKLKSNSLKKLRNLRKFRKKL